MSADNFTGQFISSTFQRLLQLSDNGSYVTDGTGSVVNLLNTTSSHALTASYVPGVTATTPGDGLWSIQFNSASTFQGSNNLLFVHSTSTLALSGSLIITGSATVSGSLLVVGSGITGSLFGTASHAEEAVISTRLGDSYIGYVTINTVGSTLAQSPFSSGNTIQLQNYFNQNIGEVTIDNVANAGYATIANEAYTAQAVQTLNQTVIVSGSVDISGSLFLNGVAVGSSGTETDPVYTAQKPTLATTGSNIFKGNQQITGSVHISGSFGLTSYGTTTPSNPAPQPGLFYFTNTDFYVSLD